MTVCSMTRSMHVLFTVSSSVIFVISVWYAVACPRAAAWKKAAF